MPDPQSTAIGAPVILTDEIRQLEEAEFVLDHVQRSRAAMQPFLPIWQEVDDNYTVTPYGGSALDSLSTLLGLRTVGTARRSAEQMSRLKDPETHQIVETISWQAMSMLLGTPDFIKALPIGIDDPEKARLISRVLMSVCDQPGNYRTNYSGFKSAFTRGTAIMEFGWETRERTQLVRKPMFNPLTGAIDAVGLSPESVIYRDNLLWREIPIRQFYPDPDATRIEDMYGAAKRFRTNWWKCMELAKANTYDLEPTMRAIRNNQQTNSPDNAEAMEREHFDLTKFEGPEMFGACNGFEYVGEVPFRRPGGRNRIITLINGQWVRGRPNPYLDGDLPWEAIVCNPISGRFYGLSPAEVIRFLQDSTDNFLMVFTDAGDLAIRGPMLLGQAFGGDPEKVRMRRVNDVIQCRNVEAVKPIPVELGALTFAAAEMARRKQSMRESAGATDIAQAIGAPGSQSATENSNLMRMAGGRVRGMVQLIEKHNYPGIGRKIHNRIRQFAEPDILARLQGDMFHVKHEDIDVDADVRWVGSQNNDSSFEAKATYSQIIATLGSIPLGTVRAFPEVFTRLFRDGLKCPDAEAIVARAVQLADEQDAKAEALAQMEATAGGSASAPSQSRGGSPPAEVKMPNGNPAGEAEQSGGMVA